jgi:hypothetical protein
MKEYVILQACSVSGLEKKVGKYLKAGFVCQGGVCAEFKKIVVGSYHQAMVR